MDARDRLIVALDHPTAEAALAQVDALGDAATRYKVGLELYLAAGARVLDEVNRRGKRVFLDLKLHDIPETVGRAAAIVAGRGVDLMTVHASGGREMLRRAVEAARPSGARVLAVTVLTSLDAGDLAADGNPLSVEELVVRRAQLAEQAGCDGVIASPQEVEAIRRVVKPGFLVVTPGVRPAGGERPKDDQKRVATAREARQRGADAVVVGRPIRDAADPRAVAKALVEELA
jgi:orotidine-5'-phosphate decarboxylase